MKNNKIRRALLWAAASLGALCILAAFCAIMWISHGRIILNYDDMGVPYSHVYSEEQTNSRLSEDMIIFDGRLYVGCGDYDANTGPVYATYFDTSTYRQADSFVSLPDEQIKRFCLLDGKLAILGTDQMGNAELGNYYLLEGEEWKTLDVLPGAIHCFDAAEFDGKTFFGLGVSHPNSPIVALEDGNYRQVPIRKNGEALDTSAHEIIRVYNFFVYKERLFAFLTLDQKDENGEAVGYFMELYVYSGDGFEYVFGALPAEDLRQVAVDGNEAYIILRDTLLKTSDLAEFSAVRLGRGVVASDIAEEDGEIYVLAWRKLGTRYESMVLEKTDKGFKKRFGIITKAPANSFCKDGDVFYISLGIRDLPSPDSGRVVAVDEMPRLNDDWRHRG